MFNKFYSKYFSSFFVNLSYSAITILFVLFFQESFSIKQIDYNLQLYLILISSIFSCALISDIILSKERHTSFFEYIITFLLSASIMFIFISYSVLSMPFSLTMQALFVFVLCKAFVYFFSFHWVFPEIFSTKIMIIGDNDKIHVLNKLIKRSRGRYTLHDTINIKNINNSSAISFTDDDSLFLEAKKAGVQLIITSFTERRGQMPLQQMLRCRMFGIKIVEMQTFYEFIGRKLYIENIKPSDLIFSSGFSLSILRRAFKRFLDIFAALFGLLLFLPFFPFVALLIFLDSPGPIFFRQVRMGLNDQLFHVIKFRSMRTDAEKGTGAVWAVKQDPRITKVGSFLRKSRIDEIPQLINVLQGEMSLIGPRPERPEFINELKKTIPFYGERHNVKPGVTGWAQVCYPYGASVEDALEKLRYDLYYIKKQSILLDIEIVIRTVLIVFTRNGAR